MSDCERIEELVKEVGDLRKYVSTSPWKRMAALEQRVADIEKSQGTPTDVPLDKSFVGIPYSCTTSDKTPVLDDTEVVRHFLGRHRRCFGVVGAREACKKCEKKLLDKVESLVGSCKELRDSLVLLQLKMSLNPFTPRVFMTTLQEIILVPLQDLIESVSDNDDAVKESKPE